MRRANQGISIPKAPPPQAFGALINVGWRYLAARRWQSFLMVLGIALGVAVVISIDLANASASRAFELSAETVTGKATHQIEDGPNGLDEAVYTRLRRENVIDLAAPIISEYVSSPQLGSQPMQLMGIDPFTDAPFRRFLGQPGEAGVPDLSSMTAFFTQPRAVMIAQPLAERYNLEVGDTLTLVVGGYEREAWIAGLILPQDSVSRRTLEGMILADIASAQELTGMEGALTRIDVILPEDDPSIEARLVDWLPPGNRLVEASARTGTIQKMTEAFQLNLSALSMLALVVGLFLIYNTMTFSVVQRRGLFGTLRCLGVTRREIFGMVLSEATLVGIIGSLLGIGLGIVLGQVTVRMVTQTVNDLYFTTTVQSVGIAPESLLKGALLGLLATVITAALPAWEAATVPPRAALLRSGLEGKVRRSLGLIALLGLVFGGLGLALFIVPSTSVVVGFMGTLFVVVGFALLSSAGLVLLLRLLVPISGALFGLIGRMAPRNLSNSLSRTAVAVAALMVSVAVIIGVALMIDSFRFTVVTWLSQSLRGDVYVSVPGFNAVRTSIVLDPRALEAVVELPGLERVDMMRSTVVDSPTGYINLAAHEDPDLGTERIFLSHTGEHETIWQNMGEGGVLLSEPLANRLGIKKAGGAVDLYTPQGTRSFPVIGIYYDYASSEGTLIMARSVYRALWEDDSLTALGLRLQPGVDPDAVARELQDRLAGVQQLLIRPNQALRDDVLEVFDRTFAITVALRLLATGVAFVGVLNSLLLLQLEKQREFGVMRALGLTGGQLWLLVMVETGLMGLAAGLFAIPAGYSLALILINVINQRSFGWTLQLLVQPSVFLQAMAIAMAAALLAGGYPAWKMSRMSTAEVIRNE